MTGFLVESPRLAAGKAGLLAIVILIVSTTGCSDGLDGRSSVEQLAESRLVDQEEAECIVSGLTESDLSTEVLIGDQALNSADLDEIRAITAACRIEPNDGLG